MPFQNPRMPVVLDGHLGLQQGMHRSRDKLNRLPYDADSKPLLVILVKILRSNMVAISGTSMFAINSNKDS